MKEDEQNTANPQVMPAQMHVGGDKNECESFDFRKHIAFDVTRMESPVRCDVCMQNATHFCMTHRGIYCTSHIVDHENKSFGFYKKNRQNPAGRHTDGRIAIRKIRFSFLRKTLIWLPSRQKWIGKRQEAHSLRPKETWQGPYCC